MAKRTRAQPVAVDPATLATGETWVNGAALKYRDNQGSPVTQTAERQSNKGVASGYASLDGGAKVPTAQLGSGVADGTTFLRGDQTWAAGAGGGAPTDAEYLTGAAHAGLSAERVVTDTPTVTWDLATAGQAKAVRAALSGDVTAAAGSGSVVVDTARGLRETSGPTLLTMGAVADGSVLQRSGSSVVGLVPWEPWEGLLHIAWGDGNPSLHDALWAFQNTAVSVAGPTPTNIGTAVGRLVRFRFRRAITVNTIRWFGLATVTGIYKPAIYNATTLARVWRPTNAGEEIDVVAGYSSITEGLPITLAADTPYWFGLGVGTTGTTAGFRSPASPIASSLGITAIPGRLADFGVRFAQVALTAGNWVDPLPTLANAAFASAGTTGTLPIFFLEN